MGLGKASEGTWKINFFVIPLQSRSRMGLRAHSSAGSEHLPYKQGVGGSNPSAPTKPKRPCDSRGVLYQEAGAGFTRAQVS